MNSKRIIKRHSELILLPTYKERFEYLNLLGRVGNDIWGAERYLNQAFYKSKEWQEARQETIIRDQACDLGIRDREIYTKLIVHHMTPITIEDIESMSKYLLDPEYLICTTLATHNALHYGDFSQTLHNYVERTSGDTKLW